MRLYLCLLLAMTLAGTAAAETLVAARTIRATSVLGPQDVTRVDGEVPGALQHPSEAVGLEARVTLYAGRPIRSGDLGPAATIERNEIIPLSYRHGGLVISAEGRALSRGGPGDVIRVMNMGSRNTITGVVTEAGSVRVAPHFNRGDIR